MKNVTLVALALSLTLAACSDSNTGTVSFALTARQAAAPAASAAFSNAAAAPSVAAAGDSTVIMLGNDSIIIRSAQLVLRKVELKRSDVASCDAVAGTDDCEEFETGATLVTLPLGSATIAQQVSVACGHLDPRDGHVQSGRHALELHLHVRSRSERGSEPGPTGDGAERAGPDRDAARRHLGLVCECRQDGAGRSRIGEQGRRE